MAELYLLYSTFPDLEQAKKVGKILLESKLIACINLLPQIYSLYFWQGKLEESQEVILLAKLPKTHTTQIQKKIMEHHPYEIPCIAFLPIATIHPDFLDWMNKQCQF